MFDEVKKLVDDAQTIVIIQPENPDGDSLGSALALEEILGELGKTVILYCPVNIPGYLGYIKGGDRVTDDFPRAFDLSIIVDTASALLLERALDKHKAGVLASKPCIVFDHHVTEGTLPFDTTTVVDSTMVATGELIYNVATTLQWPLNAQACEHLLASIMADSLGLVTEATTSNSVRAVAALVDGGASLSVLDARRREFMKKSPEILEYKGRLLQRIEYFLDGALAIIHIPWEEIAAYSSHFNPSILVIEEMRLVEGVRIAIALKTYPDGRITGKIRANSDSKVSEQIARYFGGGGHAYVAGFRTYSDDFASVKTELIGAVDKILHEYDKADHNAAS